MSLAKIFHHKEAIDLRLIRFLSEKEKQLTLVNNWSHDVLVRLRKFTTSGKSVRGSLVAYTYALIKPNLEEHIIDAACAMELFQSGFLIHDDIMDRDSQRRNNPTFHKQYELLALQNKGKLAKHFGTSMAINVGDLCFFLGYELLGSLPVDHKHLIQTFISRELEQVVLAQMHDVVGSHMSKKLSGDQILSIYRYKTARYTFSLPMWLGAALAGFDGEEIKKLITLGEKYGLLYQLRDDEIDANGTDKQNKPQTFYSYVKQDSTVMELKASLVSDAQKIIKQIKLNEAQKLPLYELLTFCDSRMR